jgi:hypothetical protein
VIRFYDYNLINFLENKKYKIKKYKKIKISLKKK